MKDEIKQIVVDNGELIAYYKDGSFQAFDTLLQEVLDYITNLQEENERLLKKSYKDDVIITKAIECIKHYAVENEDYSKIYNVEEKELLNILNGDDKSVKD